MAQMQQSNRKMVVNIHQSAEIGQSDTDKKFPRWAQRDKEYLSYLM